MQLVHLHLPYQSSQTLHGSKHTISSQLTSIQGWQIFPSGSSAATTAAAAGICDWLIKFLGRWRSNTYQEYVHSSPSASSPFQHPRHGHINYSLITATASMVCSIVHCSTICSVFCVLLCVLLNMLDICVLLFVLIAVCTAQYAWFAGYFLCSSILMCFPTGLYTHNLCCIEVGGNLAQWCCWTWKTDG